MEFEVQPEEKSVTARNVWFGRAALVLLATVLSSAISVTVVSIGWKASIDTINAVTQVKIAEHDEKIKQLELDEVKNSDLVYRDQLIDTKLSNLSLQLQEMKELNARNHGR
jgi:uncharacterized protein YllA (UPF0747 family)